MSADSIILSLVSLIAGIIVTIIAGRYYASKPMQKSLTPYIYFASPVFGGVDEDVRKDLKIEYQGEEIKDLFQLQILVGNNGQRAIRDYIEPLTLIIPAGIELLDVNVLYAYPDGRSIQIRTISQHGTPTRAAFEFPLLNRGDFFLVKILLDKAVDLKDLKFEIVAEDLPATIELKHMWDEASPEEGVDWPTVVGGLVFSALGFSISYGLYLLQRARPSLFPFPWRLFEGSIISSLALLVTAALALLFLAIGLAFIGAGIMRAFRRHPSFTIPAHLRQNEFWFAGIGTPHVVAHQRRTKSK
jgi:hypothetical protein